MMGEKRGAERDEGNDRILVGYLYVLWTARVRLIVPSSLVSTYRRYTYLPSEEMKISYPFVPYARRKRNTKNYTDLREDIKISS